MVGRLTGTFAGRPFEVSAEGQRLTIALRDVRSALALRQAFPPHLLPALRKFAEVGPVTLLKIGRIKAVRVLPRPGLLLRWLFPVLRCVTNPERTVPPEGAIP